MYSFILLLIHTEVLSPSSFQHLHCLSLLLTCKEDAHTAAHIGHALLRGTSPRERVAGNQRWALVSCFPPLEEQSSRCRMVGIFKVPCFPVFLSLLAFPCGPGVAHGPPLPWPSGAGPLGKYACHGGWMRRLGVH